MKIDLGVVIERANLVYQQRKGYVWDGYTAPELQPRIISDQVLALAEVLVEEINIKLAAYDTRLAALVAVL